MHGNGKIVSVKSAKLTIHLQMQEENNTHGLEKPAEILLKNQKLERHENCNVEMRPS